MLWLGFLMSGWKNSSLRWVGQVYGIRWSPTPLSLWILSSSSTFSGWRAKAKRRTRGHMRTIFLFQSKYHVTFFGETVSRAWIPVNMLKNFQELSLELAGVVSSPWGSVVIQVTWKLNLPFIKPDFVPGEAVLGESPMSDQVCKGEVIHEGLFFLSGLQQDNDFS